jgi:hypothetical protein
MDAGQRDRVDFSALLAEVACGLPPEQTDCHRITLNGCCTGRMCWRLLFAGISRRCHVRNINPIRTRAPSPENVSSMSLPA